ncbi:cadherin-like domain-containing protein, partial [Colwellia sp. E2M01]|uniref:Ig-like domain-containing protein n=1 Tax=Colwellia sp. E2M01 TaxID=2841561 RepID=UPI001C080B5E
TATSADLTETQLVTVTITGVNGIATITGNSTGTITEDSNAQLTGILTIEDEDTAENFFVEQNNTQGYFGMFNIDSNGNWTFDLDNFNTFVQEMSLGEQFTDNFLVWSIDGTDSQEVIITGSGANDAPYAEPDVITFNLNMDSVYTIDVLNNDIDIDGDVLSIVGTKSSLGSVSTDGENITLTTQTGFIGEIELTYTITDGHNAFSEGTVAVSIAGTLAEEAPVINVPANVEVNASGLFTKVNLGLATALNAQGQSIPISLASRDALFSPGKSIAYWQSTDPLTGLTTTASQNVTVHPIISLAKDQTSGEGKTISVDILLNGKAPKYPVTLTLDISGSVDENDYHIDSQEVIIESGTHKSVMIDIVQDNIIEGDETLIVQLNGVNISERSSQVITIVESSIAPKISLSSSQNEETRQLITPDGGLVTISSTILNPNNDNVTTQWLYDPELNIQDVDDYNLTFDPSDLSTGIYSIGMTVIGDGEGALSTTQKIYFEVLSSLAVLNDIDSDGDLIPDNEEGYSDSDQDGIPDFLDTITHCNVMPEQVLKQSTFLVEGDPGVCIRKGNTLAAAETGGLQLTDNDLEISIGLDTEAVNIGGIFDYIATGLPKTGTNYQIVLPQIQPIPVDAVYRKYSSIRGWETFAEDVNNQLHSTAGEFGYCPPPSSTLWSSGLTEGHWCVKLTIEDGGLNDNDGLSNGTIIDPGGVAVMSTSNHLPVAKDDYIEMVANNTQSIDVLSNDTDEDGDVLVITSVTTNIGSASIIDGKVFYESANDYVGDVTMRYGISDKNGGTGNAEVTVNIIWSKPPVVSNESSTISQAGSVTLNLLSNDTDPEMETLSLLSVDNADVTFSQDGQATFTPSASFYGEIEIPYTVQDSAGNTTEGKWFVEVTEVKEIATTTTKGGGAFFWPSLLLIGCLIKTRRSQI